VTSRGALAAIVVAALLLVACGGGGSSTDSLAKRIAAARTAATKHDYANALQDIAAVQTETNQLVAQHKIDTARGMRIIAASQVVGRELLALMPRPAPPSTPAPTVPKPAPPPAPGRGHGHGRHDNGGDQND
jgi:hypothetical protein